MHWAVDLSTFHLIMSFYKQANNHVILYDKIITESVNFNFSFHVTFHPQAKLKKKRKLQNCRFLAYFVKKIKKWVEAVVEKFAGNNCLPKAQF